MMGITIHETIRQLMVAQDRAMHADEVVQKLNQEYPGKWKDNAIKTHLYACSVNQPKAYIHHKSLPKFLFDLGKRKYERYNPETHGEWSKGHRIGDGADLPEVVEEVSGEFEFGIERDLEDHLSKNLNQIEEGLRLYSDAGKSGRQFNTDVGRIDFLALDRDGNLVVIELKAGQANDSVIGQLLGYMSSIRSSIAEEKKVRGIVIAADFSERVRYAATELPNVYLKKYIVNFEFKDVE